MAAARTPMTRRGGERLAGPRDALGPPLAVGQDQDEAGRSVGRRQVPVQEGLEVAIGRRQPRCLLDLEDELTAGRPVGARRDHEQVGRRRRGPRRSVPRRASSRVPAASRSRIASRRRAAVPTDGAPTHAAATIGAQVADRVAPAVVELLGLDDDPGHGAGRGAAADRHHRGRPAGVTRRAEGRVRRGRGAFVRDRR